MSISSAQQALVRKYIKEALSDRFGADYYDISKASVASITVPAISNNIAADKTSFTKTASPASVYNEVHPVVCTTEPTGGMLPNIMYNFGELSGNTTFTMASPTDAGIINH